jgi:HAMP domain-containing protein
VGKEGKINQRAALMGGYGYWNRMINVVNTQISDMVHPTSEMARVIEGVAKDDLTITMAKEIDGRPLEGEFLRTAKTVNTMVDQLSSLRKRTGRNFARPWLPTGTCMLSSHRSSPSRIRTWRSCIPTSVSC